MKTKQNSEIKTALLERIYGAPLLWRGWERLFLLFLIIGLSTANAQVGVGTTTPDASAILEVESTDKGFLPPRLTTAQRDAITSPAAGLTIYNTDNGCLEFWNNSFWVSACDGSAQPGPLSDCPLIPPYLSADNTVVNDVTNPNTGQTWMDRNLGAYNVARSPTDCYAYGNLYQWGRDSDGHEYRSSATIATQATTAAPNQGNPWDGSWIIPTPSVFPFHWLDFQDDNLWQPATGTNNPCPSGYRVPTEAELEAEQLLFSPNNTNGAWASLLKLTVGGNRLTSGSIINTGTNGFYWTSTVRPSNAANLYVNAGGAGFLSSGGFRGNGYTVRCIKD